MSVNALVQCGFYVVALTALAIPLGLYMARVYGGDAGMVERIVGPVEGAFYRLAGVDPKEEMDWKRYTLSLLAFNFFGMLAVYLLQRVQGALPLNPAHFGAVNPELSFNTATSFATNTNWQAYGGETTMSYLTQMLALTVQNFLSAATGMAVLVALVRGFARKQTTGLGSFWVDLTRSTLYILLPLSLVFALAFVSQGVVQTFGPYVTAKLLDATTGSDGKAITDQILAVGPAASQIAIKHLGTNGGGFFNVNSAHPFENPTALSNFFQMLAIFLIPGGLCFTFGALVKDRRQGFAVYAAMLALFLPLLVLCVWAEQHGNPLFAPFGVDTHASALASGGNMEGKETRFGIVNSALFATVTTGASCGAVNAMHDSFTPLGGLVPMWLIQFGEVVFGGVGSGLYGMLVYAIIAVFIAGLMVGRTPEYLGKKIESYEMKMASLVILIPAATILIGTAIASIAPAGTATLGNPGAHGFSEVLYAFTSGTGNNGSAFGGITVSGMFYCLAIGFVMLIGRFWLIVPVMAMAGSLARKKSIPESSGTLPTHTPLFVGLLAGTVVLVGALTFVPALALGPIVEHFNLFAHAAGGPS